MELRDLGLSSAAMETLKTRASTTGRSVTEEAVALIEERCGPDAAVWAELNALLHRWVRIERNEVYVDSTWLIRADRDGMPDAAEFRALVARLAEPADESCVPMPIALATARRWQQRLQRCT
jgi:plasmid stability protein